MPLDFPNSPSVGTTVTFNNRTWVYNSSGGWDLQAGGTLNINDLLPSQTGNSGKFLTTNGTTASWSSTPIGAATGGGTDRVFFEGDQTITTSYTLTANKNAMSPGPVAISTGATVTVPTGATWTVV